MFTSFKRSVIDIVRNMVLAFFTNRNCKGLLRVYISNPIEHFEKGLSYIVIQCTFICFHWLIQSFLPANDIIICIVSLNSEYIEIVIVS